GTQPLFLKSIRLSTRGEIPGTSLEEKRSYLPSNRRNALSRSWCTRHRYRELFGSSAHKNFLPRFPSVASPPPDIKVPSRALALNVARRQSGIDSPRGQSIRSSSSIQSSA